MANTTGNKTKLTEAATMVREEDLEDLEAFLAELRGKVQAAHDDGRTFMMAHYVRIVATVQPEVKRLRDRFDREALAGFRKAHKTKRLEEKAATEAAAEHA